MTVSQFFKGLLMALIAVAITFFSTSPINYALMAVTAIATILAYVGKNLIGLLSTSDPGKLNLLNFFSALLVLIATGITESIAMFVIDGKIAWIVMLKITGSVTLTYLAGTLFAGPTKESKKLI